MRFLFVAGLLSLGMAAAASAATAVVGVRAREAPERTRLVVDLDAPADYRVFAVPDPYRVVIDVANARIRDPLPLPGARMALVQGIRYAERASGDARLVIDLAEAADHSHLTLAPNGPYGHRLVVDLVPRGRTPGRRTVTPGFGDDQIVVVVDAGHGGEDPGAIGSRGTLEKAVNLAIARELVALVEARPGMRAVLTREDDYFLPLRERMERARAVQADLFISIHADAFRDRRVRGSSVYVLSQRGASSEAARWLAEQENEADRIGGVPLAGVDPMLKTVLLEMSHAAQIRTSREVADRVLASLARIGPVHNDAVQHAGFLVLKSPDVPSILVETAFISNPSEEARLVRRKHQRQVAKAIFKGVEDYFLSRPDRPDAPALERTLVADKTHRVRRGETLSRIAARYDVTTDSIRFANNLRGDRIRAGEVLTIP